MRINLEIIKALNPCQIKLDNYIKHYPNFNDDVSKFFKLKEITHTDKLWVALRLVSRDTRVIFAIDCSFAAAAYVVGATVYATYAASAAADATSCINAEGCPHAALRAACAAACVDYKQEQKNQLEVLLYLIKGEVK